MLHPLYSNVLLESTSSMDHIITFKGAFCSWISSALEKLDYLTTATWESVVGGVGKQRGQLLVWLYLCFYFILATLLELGRHAAYILLTGPRAEGAEGTVVLSKRKLKQDVPNSKVLRIGTGGGSETSEDIKEVFNRLRFSEWWKDQL